MDVYVLVIMDDMSGFVWLQPKAYTVNFVANELVYWWNAFDTRETWVKYNA